MFVHVLVPVMLVDLHPQRRQLRQNQVRQAGVDEQCEPGPGPVGQDQLDQLVADSLGGHDADPVGHVGHRLDDFRADLEAELRCEPRGPKHPQRIVGERRLRRRRCLDDPARQVGQTIVRIDKFARRKLHGHRVDREIPSNQIFVDRLAVGDLRLSAGRVVRVGAIGRDLDVEPVLGRADGSECRADIPDGIRPSRQQALGLRRMRGRGQVQVVAQPIEHRVANRPADERDVVTRGREPGAQFVGNGRNPQQLADAPSLGLVGGSGHGAPAYGGADTLGGCPASRPPLRTDPVIGAMVRAAAMATGRPRVDACARSGRPPQAAWSSIGSVPRLRRR